MTLRIAAAALLTVAFAAWAGPPTQKAKLPPEGPTAYACTVKTLQSGEECFFESAHPDAPEPVDKAKQASANVQFLKQVSETACKSASKRAPGQPKALSAQKACLQGFAAVADDCDLDGEVALVDAEGRFHPKARECYQAMGEVLASARTHAGATPACCACLARTTCKVDELKCSQTLEKKQLEAAWSKCATESCQQDCATLVPPVKKDLTEVEKLSEETRKAVQ